MVIVKNNSDQLANSRATVGRQVTDSQIWEPLFTIAILLVTIITNKVVSI